MLGFGLSQFKFKSVVCVLREIFVNIFSAIDCKQNDNPSNYNSQDTICAGITAGGIDACQVRMTISNSHPATDSTHICLSGRQRRFIANTNSWSKILYRWNRFVRRWMRVAKSSRHLYECHISHAMDFECLQKWDDARTTTTAINDILCDNKNANRENTKRHFEAGWRFILNVKLVKINNTIRIQRKTYFFLYFCQNCKNVLVGGAQYSGNHENYIEADSNFGLQSGPYDVARHKQLSNRQRQTVCKCFPIEWRLQKFSLFNYRRILLDTSEPGVPDYVKHLKTVLEEENATVSNIILSHWHNDHIGGVEDVLQCIGNADGFLFYCMCTQFGLTEFDKIFFQTVMYGSTREQMPLTNMQPWKMSLLETWRTDRR